MEWQIFQSYTIILNLIYHNKKQYQTLLYSSLFSMFYTTESGKLDVAYVEQVKILSCISQNIQNFFVAIDWVIFIFFKSVWSCSIFRGHCQDNILNLDYIIQIYFILQVFFLVYATDCYFFMDFFFSPFYYLPCPWSTRNEMSLLMLITNCTDESVS